jgi:hypothetical protein
VQQASDRQGLALEALPHGSAGVGAGQDHLQRHHPVEGFLPGPVDDTHAAPAQFALDFVAGYLGGGRLSC